MATNSPTCNTDKNNLNGAAFMGLQAVEGPQKQVPLGLLAGNISDSADA
jgi:hypothetical protein